MMVRMMNMMVMVMAWWKTCAWLCGNPFWPVAVAREVCDRRDKVCRTLENQHQQCHYQCHQRHVKSKLSVLLLITYNHCHSRASRECLQISLWHHTKKKATINAYLSKVWIVVEHRRLEKICFPHVIKPEEVEESKYCDDIIVLIAFLLKSCLLLCAWCKEESDVLEAKKLCQRWTLVNLIRKVKVVVVRWTMKSESVDSYAEREKWKW